MNREIKFRGRRIDNGKWACGYYAVHKMMMTGEMDYFIIVDEQRPQSIDPKTVGQYTGLKDKNGKDVYEGDIMRGYNAFGEAFAQLTVIEWNEEQARWAGADWSDLKGEEVIGNIYENGDLLEGEKVDEHTPNTSS